jgi:predicted nucleic acid-binding protein
MAAKTKAFFDLNIILDVLQNREPFYEASAQLLAYVETGKIQGFVAPHSLTTLFYLISKDQTPAKARATITNLLQFLSVTKVDQSTIEQAMSLAYQDFEDAVQMIAAVQCRADYFVTRNPKDFQPPMLTVIQPSELIALI